MRVRIENDVMPHKVMSYQKEYAMAELWWLTNRKSRQAIVDRVTNHQAKIKTIMIISWALVIWCNGVFWRDE